MYQSWAGSGELGADRLAQLKDMRAEVYLTDMLDDRLLLEPEFAEAVARNYLYFWWATREHEYFSVVLGNLWGEESPAVRHVILLAFEQLAHLAGAQVAEKGLWNVFDPAFCGIVPQSEAGAQLQQRALDDIKAWWKGPGASEEAKALECLAYLNDALSGFWMGLEPPEDYRERVVEICGLYPTDETQVDTLLDSGRPARQEVAVRRLSVMWKAGNSRGRDSARYEQVLRQLASSDDALVAANALRTLAVGWPETAVTASCATLGERDASWWQHYHALEVIGAAGIRSDVVTRALKSFAEDAEESLSEKARRMLQGE